MADAITILQSSGLQLRTVNEKESDATTGTILLQTPGAGAHVPKGTAVDVIVSKQPLVQLTVLLDPANPTKGQSVGVHAHLEPLEKGMQYRIVFGDGEASGWLPSSKTTHIYRQCGDFQVQAFATRGTTTITGEQVTLRIPCFPWSLAATVAAGLLVLGGAGFLHQRWTRFHKWTGVLRKWIREGKRCSWKAARVGALAFESA